MIGRAQAAINVNDMVADRAPTFAFHLIVSDSVVRPLQSAMRVTKTDILIGTRSHLSPDSGEMAVHLHP
jgi:hypothetical protein